MVRVFAPVETLKRYPAIGHPVPEWKNTRLKELHIGELRVIYHLIPILSSGQPQGWAGLRSGKPA